MTGPDDLNGPDGPRQFGNAEANLRFLGATGALALNPEILEIGTGTGGMLHALRAGRRPLRTAVALRPH